MLKIDPHASWLPLREKAEQIDNPLHKTLVTEVANHMEAEITGQLEPLMATLIPEPVYHFWQVGGTSMVLEGYEALAGFYSNMFSTGGQQFQVICDRILVDDNAVVTEGQVKQVYTREGLESMGLKQTGHGPVSAHPLWMSCAQLITVWPAGAGNKLVGEDIYFGADPMTTLQPISADELPSYYKL